MSPDLEFKPCRLLPLRGMYGLSRGASASSGLPYRVVLLGGSADSASHLTPEAKAYFPNAQGIDPGKNLLSHLAPRTSHHGNPFFRLKFRGLAPNVKMT